MKTVGYTVLVGISSKITHFWMCVGIVLLLKNLFLVLFQLVILIERICSFSD
jgi:hypothetical protein